MDQQLSKPEDLGSTWEIVELPVTQNPDGSLFRMKLVAPPFESVLEFYGGAPGLGREQVPESETNEEVAQSTGDVFVKLEQQARKLFELGAATEPPVAFDGPEPGYVHWPRLHPRNRSFIVQRLVLLAGIGPGSGRSERIATFPPDGARGPAGAGAGGAVPNGDAPAPAHPGARAPVAVGG